jgi:hypothetical protein
MSRRDHLVKVSLGNPPGVMIPTPTRVPPALPLDRLVEEEVLARGHRCFFVASDGHLDGLLTLHEVRAVPRT